MLYYPGSEAKYAEFKKKFPNALELGKPVDDPKAVPHLYVEGLAPEDASTQYEHFCTVLQQVDMPGGEDNLAEYLTAATAFANDKCWGNLATTMYAP